MRTHRHRPVESESRTVGWTHCVVPGGCSGAAHGGVVHVDACSCGATRKTERNGRHVGRGPWEAPAAK